MDQQRCRCCLATKSERYYNLFEKYKSTGTYAENIHQIAKVDVELGDGLPQYACGDCYGELHNVIEFILIIRRSDEELRNEVLQRHNKQLAVERYEVVPLSDNVVERDCTEGDDERQDDISVCMMEEEILSHDDSFHQSAEITTSGEYAKDEMAEDLQMVEEILEYDEEIPSESLSKDNDLLHELAHVAATQESVHIEQPQDADIQHDLYYPEDECDNEYTIEFNPSEDGECHLKPPKWKCVECKKVLRGDVSYEGHMNIHKNLRPHKCPLCRCQFRCRTSLKRHKESRHCSQRTKLEEISIVQMKCLDCNVEFHTEIDLLKHQLISHEGKQAQTTTCPLCPDVIVENLLNHLDSVHTDQTSFQIEEVTETLLEPLSYSALGYYNCNMCSKTFNTLSALHRHRKTQQHIDVKTEQSQIRLAASTQLTSWQCDCCSRICSSLSELNEHRKLCHGVPEADAIEVGEYVCYTSSMEALVHCEICKKKLQRKNLTKHMALHERKEKEAEGPVTKLLCAHCPREFKNNKTLHQHEKTHRGESADTVYVCTECDRQYSSQILLETHRKQAHKDRDHVCSICGNAFKLKNQLVNHMKLHLEKNIQCPHCDKKYARQFDLNVHLRSHTGEMPFECHLCDKRFAIKVRLTYHLQRHYGVKHQCKECAAEFNSRQKLKAHSFKHTGMPYRCELCEDHGFPNRVVFKRHLDRVHHASMTDEALNEMFQRNTGRAIKIKQVSELYMTTSNEDAEMAGEEEEIVAESPILISSSDIATESEIIHT